MMLPDHLIDYVILHELTHTIYKNHGKAFWQYLDKITGDVNKLEKEIKCKEEEHINYIEKETINEI